MSASLLPPSPLPGSEQFFGAPSPEGAPPEMSSNIQVVTIDKSLPGKRLDTWLRVKFPALSRGAIQRLIQEGHIRVNGRAVKPTHTPRAGEQVQVEFPEA